ncbi:hypothetical protein N0V83_010924 [Neocucurbitaria cava]|uniref:Uncharacterized protein n=1 Tax=Neocucurbitaria cava TaxID=798079 RepID=A0A9W8XY49_9PLEO|nr:hypothetical protein N0V83_010924 [Neocucurbitaria cava]
MSDTTTSSKTVLQNTALKENIRLRVQQTVNTINNMRGGENLSNYSISARKELASSETLDVILGPGQDASMADEVPKLALVVASKTFREKIVEKPEIPELKVVSASIDIPSVAILMNWLKDAVHSKAHQIPKVPIPADIVDKAKLVHAANILGMDRYVNHVVASFRHDVRLIIPSPEQCSNLEKYGISSDHAVSQAVGERFGYLLRTGKFFGDRHMLMRFLARSEKIGQAVRDADARAQAKRAAQNQN